jgi:type IV pilus assembly protein PilO
VSGGSGQLILQGTVKTYRYLDDEETAAEAKKQGAKGAAGVAK